MLIMFAGHERQSVDLEDAGVTEKVFSLQSVQVPGPISVLYKPMAQD
jgi:hypothetical protein